MPETETKVTEQVTSAQPEEAAKSQGAPAASSPPPPAPDVSKYEKELEQLRAQMAEKDEAIRYWHEQAKGAKPEVKIQKQEEEDKTDLLELISAQGPKGLENWLKQKGFVSSEEVDRRVEARARQIAKEAEITQRYPELKDNDSEFFKATAKELARLRGSMPDDLALELAADRAELASLRAKAAANGAEKSIKDEERQARARAASGDAGRRSAKQSEEPDDALTPEQLQICESMGIDPEAYKKRAKAGVQYMGKTR